jgi:hypothetical protein
MFSVPQAVQQSAQIFVVARPRQSQVGQINLVIGPAVQVRPLLLTRWRLTITNVGNTNPAFLGPTSAVTSATGFQLPVAGTIVYESKGAVWAIVDANTKITFLEEFFP